MPLSIFGHSLNSFSIHIQTVCSQQQIVQMVTGYLYIFSMYIKLSQHFKELLMLYLIKYLCIIYYICLDHFVFVLLDLIMKIVFCISVTGIKPHYFCPIQIQMNSNHQNPKYQFSYIGHQADCLMAFIFICTWLLQQCNED